ncbi:hypothetical protein Q0F98_34160 [Paenibacillus amylolyticus]|nr:hypothetical protein Q0F98_34160 [Paenibacillus amylolyticus]
MEEKKYFDTSPVKIIWSFDNESENHPEILAEEVNELEIYTEGSVKKVSVNVYERNPIARKKCIEHYGLCCQVCGFNFVNIYGIIGENFIHVHHLKPLHEINEKYEIDPVGTYVLYVRTATLCYINVNRHIPLKN